MMGAILKTSFITGDKLTELSEADLINRGFKNSKLMFQKISSKSSNKHLKSAEYESG